MSSLWTPSGEHPVGDRRPSVPAGSGDQGGSSTPPRRSGGDDQPVREARTGAASSRTERAASEAELEALRKQLAAAPAETVIANHCYGLFELAAVYLAERPAKLADARLAIDAFGYLVDGLGDRLGEPSAGSPSSRSKGRRVPPTSRPTANGPVAPAPRAPKALRTPQNQGISTRRRPSVAMASRRAPRASPRGQRRPRTPRGCRH